MDLPRAVAPPRRRRLEPADYIAGVRAGDRALLARAITLVESTVAIHRQQARAVMDALMPHTGGAQRIGITGVPGVGKSTFVERFGLFLVERGHRVAVLAVDPSSRRTGGSILGDKTRMERLSTRDEAFIRPSPSAGTLGGVARSTRETMLLCEAAGYDVILVETVGVGQSETVVADMVDIFLVLMLAGAGDELQGIKRGVLEIADLIAVNKADGDNLDRARRAARDYANALHVMHPADDPWQPPARTCSALTGDGIATLWDDIAEHRRIMQAHGLFADKRRAQQVRWLWSLVGDRLLEALRAHPAVRERLPAVEAAVRAGDRSPTCAADDLLAAFGLVGD